MEGRKNSIDVEIECKTNGFDDALEDIDSLNEMEGMRMREWTEHEKDMIHTVMHMAYLEGIDEGKRQAQEVIRALSDKVSELYAKHEKENAQ
jgi:hypothetical protein